MNETVPPNPQQQKDAFLANVRQVIEGNYAPADIGTMDEISVCLEEGSQTKRVTVALSCFADGSKGSPFIILKRSVSGDPKPPRGLTFPVGSFIASQRHGWMSEEKMLAWLETAWTNRPASHTPSLLIMDALPSHTCAKVLERVRSLHTLAAVIPGGPDVGLAATGAHAK
eukprot:GHVU01130654.1.p1 GENE.GHVU01130654.1~~GHVU01130654.1.p1  ORF type:complete len:170 (+),score=9.79 GHVU01130654.1:344-853(+)